VYTFGSSIQNRWIVGGGGGGTYNMYYSNDGFT